MIRPLFVLSLLFFSGCVIDPGEKTPNVILIFLDDMGNGDLSSTGAISYGTPNIDQLATDGIRFTNYETAQAVCSASRAGLLTGCYPNRIGFSGALFPKSKKGIHQDELTMAELVKQSGYATAIVGKWHLGDAKEFLPLQHGFDEYFGIPYSNDMWPVDYDGNPATNWKKDAFPPLYIYDGNEPSVPITTLEDQATITGRYTERAVSFIRKNKDRPFFLYVPHSMPHVPINASEKFRGKSKQGMYGDVMMEIDWSVGEIMKAVKESGIEKNTLIIFTSDNGPWQNYGNHAGSTGGLREGKGTSFEGGHRVPCIMAWKDRIKPGQICNSLMGAIDIYPTIAELVGAKLPDHRIDGISFANVLLENNMITPRNEYYYYYRRNNLEAVREGNWKLVLPHPGRTYAGFAPGSDGHPGEVNENAPFDTALFDLRRDPGERYDLRKVNKEVLQRLLQLAEKARADLGDDLTERPCTNCREAGNIE